MNRALFAVTLILVGTTACRMLPAGASAAPSSSPTADATSSEQRSQTTASQAPILAEAPEACGFPPGTPLEYAGRSTTAALDVQEVVGDPMSDDRADIYVTRDKFDQGELHGRLVCAIYIDTPGFVEVTVHPEDGGRFVPPTPYPSTTPPPDGLSEAEAIDAARAHLGEPDAWEVAVAQAGPIGQVLPYVLEDDHYPWAHDLPPDRWTWRVFLVRGDRGVDVLVDYLDGSILGTTEGIVN